MNTISESKSRELNCEKNSNSSVSLPERQFLRGPQTPGIRMQSVDSGDERSSTGIRLNRPTNHNENVDEAEFPVYYKRQDGYDDDTHPEEAPDDANFDSRREETTSLKKKRVALRKAPEAPKRFKSSYILFFMAKQQEIKNELGSNAAVGEVSKRSSEMWKKLSDEERLVWEDKASKDKERYNQERAAYTGPWQVPWKRAKKDPSAPKRPMSAFLYFSQDKRKVIKAANPNMRNTEISRVLGEMWKNASEEERQVHIDREAHEREAYKVEMAVWRKEDATRKDRARKDLLEKAKVSSKRLPVQSYISQPTYPYSVPPYPPSGPPQPVAPPQAMFPPPPPSYYQDTTYGYNYNPPPSSGYGYNPSSNSYGGYNFPSHEYQTSSHPSHFYSADDYPDMEYSRSAKLPNARYSTTAADSARNLSVARDDVMPRYPSHTNYPQHHGASYDPYLPYSSEVSTPQQYPNYDVHRKFDRR